MAEMRREGEELDFMFLRKENDEKEEGWETKKKKGGGRKKNSPKTVQTRSGRTVTPNRNYQ